MNQSKTNDFSPTLIQTNSGDDFAQTAARFIFKTIETSNNPLIALPTGNTPLDIYKYMLELYSDRHDVWQGLRYIALDEYKGLAADDRRLFHRWVGHELLDTANVPAENRITFRSDASDPATEIERIEAEIINEGGIDIAVLGLGTNGHIAFNEPGSPFSSKTRIVALSPETRQSNAAYWGGNLDDVPTEAYTLGLRTLVEAKTIILLVSGMHKADILNETLYGEITEAVPSTILRTHPNVTVIADKEAIALP